MNSSRSIPTIIGVALSLLVALYVIVQVASSNTNSLGKLFHYLPIATFFIGLINPKLGLYLLCILGTVVDKLTNVLYLTGSVQFFDEKLLKLSAPICLLGMLISALTSGFKNSDQTRRKSLLLLFGLAVAMTVVLFGAAIFAHIEYGLMPAMSFALTFAPYAMLLFIAPALLRKKEELTKWMFWTAAIMLIGSVVGIRQHFMGFTPDEEWIAIVTQVVQFQFEFENPRAMGWFRYPGTLAGVAATMMLYLVVLFIKRKDLKIGKFAKLMGVFVFIITAICLYSSGKRLGMGMVFIGVLYFWVLHSSWKTVTMYIAGIFAMGIMIIYPEEVTQKLLDTQKAIFAKAKTDDAADKVKFVARLGTFSARVETFGLLAKKSTYTPWGKDDRDLTEEEIEAHSLPIQILIGQGYIPTAIMMIITIVIVVYFHRAFFKKEMKGTMAYYMFCIFAAQITTAVLGAKYIAGFPICYFMGLELGVIAIGVLNWRSRSKIQSTKRESLNKMQAQHQNLSMSTNKMSL